MRRRPPTPALSLRKRLVALLLGAVAVVGLAAIAVAYVDARHEIDELLDAHLAQAATLILAQAANDGDADEIELEHAPELHRYDRRVAFQLWANGTGLLLHSAKAPDERLSPRDEGFSDVDRNGKRWRVFSGWDRERRLLVQVGEERRGRDDIAAAVARALVVPLAIALPVLGVLVWFAVGAGLSPLRAIAAELARRAPSQLGPLDVGPAPAEVAPLVTALDRLFARVRASIESERRFTADAAHELRTPIAALRAQAQVALGAASDDVRTHALSGVITGCDRAAHLVDQLLTLARLEPGESVRGAPIELRALARAALAEIAPLAVGRNVDVALDDGPELDVIGDRNLIAVLLRNLLDNAIRYSPDGSAVHVRIAAEDGAGASLAVVDDGPGVPAAERARLGERFFRREGETAMGTGLGLSIARRIAELHGAQLHFDDAPHGRGLAAIVRFPRR